MIVHVDKRNSKTIQRDIGIADAGKYFNSRSTSIIIVNIAVEHTIAMNMPKMTRNVKEDLRSNNNKLLGPVDTLNENVFDIIFKASVRK